MRRFGGLNIFRSVLNGCKCKTVVVVLALSVAKGLHGKTVYADSLVHVPESSYTLNEPALVTQTNVSLQNTFKLIKDAARSCYDIIVSYCRFFTRATILSLTFTPALISSPLLLTHSTYLQDIWWAITRYCLSNGGPCCIKFAQWLSTRPDLFPIQACKQLQSLQSATKLPKWEYIHKQLIVHFGENYAEDFEILMREGRDGKPEPKIVGSGCVAYVLLGKLKNKCLPSTSSSQPCNQQVVIKMMRPGVNELIRADLELLAAISDMLEFLVPAIRNVSFRESVREFSEMMAGQTDMVAEGRCLDRFRENFHVSDSNYDRDNEKPCWGRFIHSLDRLAQRVTNTNVHNVQNEVTFPQPVWEFTNNDILVERFERGVLMHEMMKYSDTPTKRKLAQIGLDAIFKMIFIDNFIHADLHPGNIICLSQPMDHNECERKYPEDNSDVSRDDSSGDTDNVAGHHTKHGKKQGKKRQIPNYNKATADLIATEYSVTGCNKLSLSFIDAGLVVSLTPQDRRNFLDMFQAVVMNDGRKVGKLMIERSAKGPENVLNPEEFCAAMQDVVGNIHSSGVKLGRVAVNSLLERVLVLAYNHQVKLESRFVSVIVAMGILEGMGRQLDPEVDVLARVAPYALRAAVTEQTDKIFHSHQPAKEK